MLSTIDADTRSLSALDIDKITTRTTEDEFGAFIKTARTSIWRLKKLIREMEKRRPDPPRDQIKMKRDHSEAVA